MKTSVAYSFNLNNSQQLETVEVSSYETVSVVLKSNPRLQWDPLENKEIELPSETGVCEMTMTVEDARELANNLIKAAEFAEQNGPAQQRVGGRLR